MIDLQTVFAVIAVLVPIAAAMYSIARTFYSKWEQDKAAHASLEKRLEDMFAIVEAHKAQLAAITTNLATVASILGQVQAAYILKEASKTVSNVP